MWQSSDSVQCRHDSDGLFWLQHTQAPLKNTREQCACVACVLIISVTHSLCVFRCLTVIIVHVCVCISVSQSARDLKPLQGSNYPLNIHNLGLIHAVWDLKLNANWFGSWLLVMCGGGRWLENKSSSMIWLGQFAWKKYDLFLINFTVFLYKRTKTKENKRPIIH